MDREEKRRKLEEEYGKHVFFVSELLYCPDYRTVVHPAVVLAKQAEGIEAHRLIQQDYIKRYPTHKVEVEKEMVLDRGDYVLVGHADIIDHTDLVLYEIKPNHLGDKRYLYQLSAYAMMLRELTGKQYYPAFIVYRLRDGKLRYGIIKPFYIITYILDVLDKIARVRMEKRRQIRIGGKWCKKCIWNDSCSRDVVIRHRNGFVEVESNE